MNAEGITYDRRRIGQNPKDKNPEEILRWKLFGVLNTFGFLILLSSQIDHFHQQFLLLVYHHLSSPPMLLQLTWFSFSSFLYFLLIKRKQTWLKAITVFTFFLGFQRIYFLQLILFQYNCLLYSVYTERDLVLLTLRDTQF